MSELKLWQYGDAIERVLAESVDRDTGEIGDEALEALKNLEMSRDEKALRVGVYILGELAESEAVKKQADRLATRAKRHKARAEALKDYLFTHCEKKKKLSNDIVTISWRKSDVVEIVDEKLLSGAYLTTTVTTVPDKNAIKKAFRDGAEVTGALLRKRDNLQVG